MQSQFLGVSPTADPARHPVLTGAPNAKQRYPASSLLQLHAELQPDITQESVHQVMTSLVSNLTDQLALLANQHLLHGEGEKHSINRVTLSSAQSAIFIQHPKTLNLKVL